ncbi:MAG TPA: hypothetical protein VF074_00250, partial [Pyrinomonadaceae bacterium]
MRRLKLLTLLLILPLLLCGSPVTAQRKAKPKPKPKATAKPVDELEKLREQYVAATQEVKNSLEKLQAFHTK